MTLDSSLKDMRHGIRHAAVYAGATALSKATGFVMVPVYTRLLDRSEYGLLELLTRSAEVASIILALGIGSAVLRFYFDSPRESDRRSVVSSGLVLTLFVGAGATGVLALFARQLSVLVLGTPAYEKFVLLLLATNLCELAAIVPMAFLRARQQSALYSTITVSRLVLGLGLNIYFVVVLRMGVLGVLYSGLIGSGLMAIVVVALCFVRVGIRLSLDTLRPMARYSAPLVPATLAMFIIHNADRFFLEHYAGLDQVGVYALAYRFGMLLPVLVLEPFGLAFVPLFYSAAKRPDAGALYSRALTYLTVATVWFALGISILGRDVLRVVASPEYVDAYRPLPLVIFAFVFLGMQAIFEIGIHLRKRTVLRLAIVSGTALLTLLLCRVLVPGLGIMGAGLATLVSFIGMAVLSYSITRRLYPVAYDFRRIGHTLALAVALLLASAFFLQGATTLAICLRSLLAVSFPALLALSGFLRRDEKALLLGVIRRRRRTRMGVAASARSGGLSVLRSSGNEPS